MWRNHAICVASRGAVARRSHLYAGRRPTNGGHLRRDRRLRRRARRWAPGEGAAAGAAVDAAAMHNTAADRVRADGAVLGVIIAGNSARPSSPASIDALRRSSDRDRPPAPGDDLQNLPIDLGSADRGRRRMPHMRERPRSRRGARNGRKCMKSGTGKVGAPEPAPAWLPTRARSSGCARAQVAGAGLPARSAGCRRRAQVARATERPASGSVTAAITAREPAIRPMISPPFQCSSL